MLVSKEGKINQKRKERMLIEEVLYEKLDKLIDLNEFVDPLYKSNTGNKKIFFDYIEQEEKDRYLIGMRCIFERGKEVVYFPCMNLCIHLKSRLVTPHFLKCIIYGNGGNEIYRRTPRLIKGFDEFLCKWLDHIFENYSKMSLEEEKAFEQECYEKKQYLLCSR